MNRDERTSGRRTASSGWPPGTTWGPSTAGSPPTTTGSSGTPPPRSTPASAPSTCSSKRSAISERVVGYYAINPTQVVRDDVPRSLARGWPQTVPAWKLGKLAVHVDLRADKDAQWGRQLLRDALETIVRVADAGGGKVIVVDADNPGLLDFYPATASRPPAPRRPHPVPEGLHRPGIARKLEIRARSAGPVVRRARRSATQSPRTRRQVQSFWPTMTSWTAAKNVRPYRTAGAPGTHRMRPRN